MDSFGYRKSMVGEAELGCFLSHSVSRFIGGSFEGVGSSSGVRRKIIVGVVGLLLVYCRPPYMKCFHHRSQSRPWKHSWKRHRQWNLTIDIFENIIRRKYHRQTEKHEKFHRVVRTDTILRFKFVILKERISPVLRASHNF